VTISRAQTFGNLFQEIRSQIAGNSENMIFGHYDESIFCPFDDIGALDMLNNKHFPNFVIVAIPKTMTSTTAIFPSENFDFKRSYQIASENSSGDSQLVQFVVLFDSRCFYIEKLPGSSSKRSKVGDQLSVVDPGREMDNLNFVIIKLAEVEQKLNEIFEMRTEFYTQAKWDKFRSGADNLDLVARKYLLQYIPCSFRKLSKRLTAKEDTLLEKERILLEQKRILLEALVNPRKPSSVETIAGVVLFNFALCNQKIGVLKT